MDPQKAAQAQNQRKGGEYLQQIVAQELIGRLNDGMGDDEWNDPQYPEDEYEQ
ncbi:hypothetical protein IBX73_03300 [candidate division WOR-3 bacterium]|nr:hypothetical protein [candidate division WOR-3 bacterium]